MILRAQNSEIEAYPLVNKLGKILVTYDNNIIEVEGHTDNVPIHSSKYEDNNVLSMYRALAVANYLRDTTNTGSCIHKVVWPRRVCADCR
ncbi:MAG: flagellar motor protein MotB [Roseburia sp.]